jgi:hypothetical protein
MAITHTQNPSLSGPNSTTIAVSVAATSIGDLILIFAFFDGSTTLTLTVADSQTNTWTTIHPDTTLATGRIHSWFAYAKNTSATTVTVTGSAQGTFVIGMGDVLRGTATSSPIGSFVSTTASGTPTTPSMTMDMADEAVVAWCVDSTTAVGNILGSAATKGCDDTFQDWSEYRILSGGSGSSGTAAFAGSGTYEIAAAVVRPPSAAGLTTQKRIATRPFPFKPGSPPRGRFKDAITELAANIN